MNTQDQRSAPAETLAEEEHTAEASDAAEAGRREEPTLVETLQEQLAQQERKAEEYFDQLQRLQADFQTFRRRTAQERLEIATRGKEEVLRALLPVLHNFRLALHHADEDAQAVRQGIQMIWQQFEGFFRDQKVESIPTIGQVFDPAYHEVVSTVPASAATPANTIVTEVKAGYCLDGRLLAPAQVIVAQAVDPAPQDTEASTRVEVTG